MAKGKRQQKRKIMIYKTLHKNLGAPEGEQFPIHSCMDSIVLICIINSGQIMSCVCLNRGLRGAKGACNVSLIHDMTGL